ncbi:MAG: MotA/TolQ/ExbB proton channel family protein [Verrucomicrobiaceae bacterium]
MLLDIFQRGGPVMWPLLVLSVISAAVVLERCWFLLRESTRRKPQDTERVFACVEKGEVAEAMQSGANSRDAVAQVLHSGLAHGQESLTNALLRASAGQLQNYSRGLSVLDTAITLAPLLGLLGTVTGMIRAFGLMRGELDAPAAITGGIAEALIATAFGLSIAIVALIPFNYLNARLETMRHELQDACTRLEILLLRRPA